MTKYFRNPRKTMRRVRQKLLASHSRVSLLRYIGEEIVGFFEDLIRKRPPVNFNPADLVAEMPLLEDYKESLTKKEAKEIAT